MRTLPFLLALTLVLAAGACSSDSSPAGGPAGPGSSDVPAIDGSALADTPGGDSSTTLTKDTGEAATDEVENPCPDKPPESGAFCEGDATCKYGQECCCGECFDALVCTCGGTKWGCYFTDACLLPPCVDAGSLDTGGSADAPLTDGGGTDGGVSDGGEAPDTGGADIPAEDGGSPGDLPEGKCRSDADCSAERFESCHGPGDPTVCGICREPEEPCTEDNECEGDTVCEHARGTCPTCSGEMECVPRCGGSAGCLEGEACNEAGHCVDAPCSNDSDCPDLFLCNSSATAPSCKRRGCQDDAGCPADGRCVRDLCWDTFGTCMPPVPAAPPGGP